MRQDYQAFVQRDAEIIVVGPENGSAFARHWQQEKLPFTGIPDPQHQVADHFGQQVKLLKLGRLPAMILIDKSGQICYRHYGHSMSDIPANSEILAVIDTRQA